MEDVKTLGKGMVPRAGVEPARPFGQRILSPQRNSISMKSSLAGSKSLWWRDGMLNLVKNLKN